MFIRITGRLRTTQFDTKGIGILGANGPDYDGVEIAGNIYESGRTVQAIVTLSDIEVGRLVASQAPFQLKARDDYFANLRATADRMHPCQS